MLHLALVEQDGGTLLRIEDAIFGNVSDSYVSSQESGWTQLFRDGLKAFVEATR